MFTVSANINSVTSQLNTIDVSWYAMNEWYADKNLKHLKHFINHTSTCFKTTNVYTKWLDFSTFFS